MPATVIDGKALAAATKAEAAEKVRELKSRGINPCLAVILVGENPASQVYVRGKINDCAQCGIESRSINLPADTTQDALLAEVKKLADDSAVHGILVQLPLPAQIDEKAVIDAIPPEKDVDGFSPVNVGRMQIGEPCYLPCTPAGCIRMIESTGTDIVGKSAVVIGRSNIVGKPAALLLLAKNATVTICHSRTKNLKEVCAAADILVAAVGREGFVTGDMVKPGAVVIDVGINRGADGKLHGDVNFAEAAEKAAYITPVPGGVGPMTRAMLITTLYRMSGSPAVTGENPYSDVPAGSYYEKAVIWAMQKGVANGMGGGKFEPDGQLTRAQLVTVLYRAAGEPDTGKQVNPFTDVPDDTWYTRAVIWAANNGIVNGVAKNTFAPDDSITREQIAAMLYRYAGAEAAKEDKLSAFPDAAKVSDWAKEALNWAVASGLINGVADANGTANLEPQSTATRAQIATILMRWLEK